MCGNLEGIAPSVFLLFCFRGNWVHMYKANVICLLKSGIHCLKHLHLRYLRLRNTLRNVIINISSSRSAGCDLKCLSIICSCHHRRIKIVFENFIQYIYIYFYQKLVKCCSLFRFDDPTTVVYENFLNEGLAKFSKVMHTSQ